MTRSRRKTPCCGMTCKESDKSDKARANRKMRRRLRQTPTDPDQPSPKKNDFSSPWDFAKDGKQWCPKFETVWRK